MTCLETCLACTSPTFPREARIFFSRSPKLRQRQNVPVDRHRADAEKCPSFGKKYHKVWYHLFWLVDLVVSCRFFTHQWWTPQKNREETLVPGHGQDFNTLFYTAWNEPKIALWSDWPRVHFVKKVGSYKMIRPAKNTLFTKWHGWPEKCPYKMPPFVRKMPLEWNMGQAIS